MVEEKPIWLFDNEAVTDLILTIGHTGKGKSMLLATLLSQAAQNNKIAMRDAAIAPVDILREWSVPQR